MNGRLRHSRSHRVKVVALRRRFRFVGWRLAEFGKALESLVRGAQEVS